MFKVEWEVFEWAMAIINLASCVTFVFGAASTYVGKNWILSGFRVPINEWQRRNGMYHGLYALTNEVVFWLKESKTM